MKADLRVVIDTGVLISRALIPSSVAAQAIKMAVDTAQIFASTSTLAELVQVLTKPKFDGYVSHANRRLFLEEYLGVVDLAKPESSIQLCRDPSGDKFLALARHVRAHYLITGDQDLLVLDPFGETRILTPRAFLEIKP